MIFLNRLKIGPVFVLSILLAGGTAVFFDRFWATADAMGESSPKGKTLHPKGVSSPEEDQPARVDIYGDPLPEGALARLGTARLRGDVLGFSSDGKSVITIGADRALHHWDSKTGKERERRQLSFSVGKGRFEYFGQKGRSANGQCFVSEDEETLRVWEVATGKEIGKTPNPYSRYLGRPILGLTVTNDGKMLAISVQDRFAGIGRQVRLFNTTTGKEVFSVLWQENDAPAFSPDGKLLALANKRGFIYLYDTSAGKELRQIKAQKPMPASPKFSPDGKTLAWLEANQTIQLVDVADGSKAASLEIPGKQKCHSLQFLPDGKRLAAGGDEGILIWDVTARKLLQQIRLEKLGNFDPLGYFAFSPDGQTLAVNRFGGGTSLFDSATGKLLRQTEGRGLIRILFSPDGKTLLSHNGFPDNALRLWDTASGRPLHVLNNLGRVFSFSADSKFLLTAVEGTVRFWDVSTGKEARKIDMNDDHSPKRKYFFDHVSSDGKSLTVLGSWNEGKGTEPKRHLRIWDLDTGKVLKRQDFPYFRTQIFNATWISRNGTIVFTEDNSILRDGLTGKEIARVSEKIYFPFSFSWDSKKLAVAGFEILDRPGPGGAAERMHVARMFDLKTGRQLGRIATGPAGDIEFSPDGKILASAGREELCLWEVATGKCVYWLPAPAPFSATDGVPFTSHFSFSPDGRSIATALKDSTILIWDVAPGYRSTSGPKTKLSGKTLEQLWADLSGEDAAGAYRAVWRLAASPDQAVGFLKEHLKPPADNSGHMQKLVADLGNEKFAVRQAAFLELKKFDIEMEPVLRRSLNQATEEMRRRLESLLAMPPGIVRGREVLRGYRAVQILEYAGTPQARQVLETLSQGHPAYRLTQEARASLERWK